MGVRAFRLKEGELGARVVGANDRDDAPHIYAYSFYQGGSFLVFLLAIGVWGSGRKEGKMGVGCCGDSFFLDIGPSLFFFLILFLLRYTKRIVPGEIWSRTE